MIFLADVKPFVVIFFVLADVIANLFDVIFMADLIAIFLADVYAIDMWWMFLPHWSFFSIIFVNIICIG